MSNNGCDSNCWTSYIGSSVLFCVARKNNSVHGKGERRHGQLSNVILDTVRLKLALIRFKKSVVLIICGILGRLLALPRMVADLVDKVLEVDSPTAVLFDVDIERISIVTVNTKEYHSDVLTRFVHFGFSNRGLELAATFSISTNSE
ncbi:hypothetical protein Tco_0299550 [Tanacetum coccineum]